MSVDFDVVDALAGFAEDLHSEGNFAMRLHDAVKKLKEERDTLKADLDVVDSDLQLAVKRLNAEVMRLHEKLAAEAKDYTQDDVNTMTTDMIAIRKAAERAAFKRGAEAMRAVVLRWLEENYASIEGEQIRALPIPEDTTP